MLNIEEEWRAAVGYEGLYEVSSAGRVRVLFIIRGGSADWYRAKRDTPKLLKPTLFANGYLRVPLCSKLYLVHRLVLMAFRGPPPPGCEGAHGNGARSDNRLENLRWATGKENQADCLIHGTKLFGIAKPAAKLTDAIVREARALHAQGVTCKDLAKKHGVAPQVMQNAVNRKTWAHVA